ncbi:MAG: hypothetical protein COB50_00220 [Thiotrichales bacterium]|nr:MAG: hypothetical protein COB50_00220 [Thiotrichales bacterium]
MFKRLLVGITSAVFIFVFCSSQSLARDSWADKRCIYNNKNKNQGRDYCATIRVKIENQTSYDATITTIGANGKSLPPSNTYNNPTPSISPLKAGQYAVYNYRFTPNDISNMKNSFFVVTFTDPKKTDSKNKAIKVARYILSPHLKEVEMNGCLKTKARHYNNVGYYDTGHSFFISTSKNFDNPNAYLHFSADLKFGTKVGYLERHFQAGIFHAGGREECYVYSEGIFEIIFVNIGGITGWQWHN